MFMCLNIVLVGLDLCRHHPDNVTYNPKFYSEPGFIRTLKSDVSFLSPTFTFVSPTATTNYYERCLGCNGRHTQAT